MSYRLTTKWYNLLFLCSNTNDLFIYLKIFFILRDRGREVEREE